MSVLRLTRRFAAPRERVFAAWTDPELLRTWRAAQHGWSTSAAEVDLRPRAGTGSRCATPSSEIMRGSEGTVVTVEFVADDGVTQVTVTHEGFADDRIAGLHREGWTG